MVYYILYGANKSNFKLIASGMHGTITHELQADQSVQIIESPDNVSLPKGVRMIHKSQYTELLSRIRTEVTPVSLELYQSLLTQK